MSLTTTITNADSVEALSSLESESVDIFVTSPPYDNLRNYGGHKWDFEGTAKQLARVLKNGGVICWNVADSIIDDSETLTSFRQAIFFKDVCKLNISDTLIWKKVHVAAPNSRQYHQMHEYVFIISKGKPKAFNPIEDRKNKYAGLAPFGRNSKRNADGEMVQLKQRKPIKEFGKRSNVWEGNSRAQENPCEKLDHPAMMPKWLVRDLIISWSNPGDLVGDPFAGSGTTGNQALQLGRSIWLNEVNADYIPMLRQSCIITGGLGI